MRKLEYSTPSNIQNGFDIAFHFSGHLDSHSCIDLVPFLLVNQQTLFKNCVYLSIYFSLKRIILNTLTGMELEISITSVNKEFQDLNRYHFSATCGECGER